MPQPSGKLARWGMVIQDLDVTILHRSGKHNSNADDLSRCPLPVEGASVYTSFGIVAAAEPEKGELT